MEKNHLPEIDLLTTLFCKPREFHPYVMKIEKDFFSESLRGFFDVFRSYYTKYGKPPPSSVFKIQYDEGSEEQRAALEIFESIKTNYSNIKNLDQNFLLENLNLFVKKSFIKKALLQSYDEYEVGNYDKIISNFQRLNEAIIDNDMGKNYFDPKFFVEKYNGEKSGTTIKTGSTQFDENFGGLHRKTLTIVAGPSNSGKTMFLVNLAAMLLQMTDELKNILYITMEIDEEQIGRRVDASLLGEPLKTLRSRINDKEASETLISKFIERKESGNKLVVKAMRSGSTAADIEALIRNLSFIPMSGEETPFKPDIVMVDYFGLMRPIHQSKNANSYEIGRNIAEELRAVAQDFNVAMVAAAQTNRSSFGNDVGQDAISDSIAIAQTADIMLTINRNESLDLANQIMIYLAKSRFSRAGSKFLFSADYDCMRLNDVDEGHVSDVDGGNQ